MPNIYSPKFRHHRRPTSLTSGLAAASGYSVQQIRDLERLAVIPPAVRRPNGYRRFGSEHVAALRAYRNLAIAVGPVIARSTMREAQALPYDEAIARIVALHVALARSREGSIAALQALDDVAALVERVARRRGVGVTRRAGVRWRCPVVRPPAPGRS